MSKTIVVYYSAQGHSKKIAEKIAELKDADLFEIEPVNAYSEDDLNYMSEESRVMKEFKDVSLRENELKNAEVANWSEYDAVILCYPIWCGIAAWPTNAFVKAVDWNGKKILPVAISNSSPAGESAFLLEDEANGGEWGEAVRIYQNAEDEEIKGAF